VPVVVGALNGVPDLMRGEFAGERFAFPPGVQAAVADVVVVVHGADVVPGVTAAVPSCVMDGVDARVGPEPAAVGHLGVVPGRADVAGQPLDFAAANVRVEVYGAVLVGGVEPKQLTMVEPVFLPGLRRAACRCPLCCVHRFLHEKR
jgi:hypothetical protein